ncbi:MAG TPA: glycosyltransferase [Pyrinomonadaceae bacterium]|jgi:predicted glycosyltransferase
MRERATLLFYCQHSLGMGHLVRSLALVAGLGERFRVVLLNGGRLPKRLAVPAGVEVVNLPPLGLAADGRLVSRDRRRTVERASALRRRIIMETYRELRPRVVFVELFPFGRKKFAGELLPLLDAARGEGRPRPLVCCSLRDILVGKKHDQQKHDARAAETANKYFDAVLVHSDPTFARLEESFGSCGALRTPVHYTGFVLPEHGSGPDGWKRAVPWRGESKHGGAAGRPRQILVSAGGGLVGEPLFRAAVEAYREVRRTPDVSMKIVTGPFLPEAAWLSLREAARALPGLSVRRFMPDLCAEMRRSAATVSQCGYNTALDVLRARVPALVVPFSEGGEDEQSKRARRLEQLGALRVLEQHELGAGRFAGELRALLEFQPRALGLDLRGVGNTALLVERLLRALPAKARPPLDGRRGVREVRP